ncbi:MAG: hypothetical protein AAF542_23230 [Pseudomonadota bacterium]
MNVGAILGAVVPINKAIVRFDGVWAGHISNRLDVFNIKSGIANNLGLVHADQDNYFVIPFEWEAHSVGDFKGATFKVSAFDTKENSFGQHVGQMAVGHHVETEWQAASQDLISGGVLELANFPLASAISTVFTPRLSTDSLVAIGAAHIVI